MRYYHIQYSNGYCGCDENIYLTEQELYNASIEEYFSDFIESYNFFEPDSRFCDMDNEEDIQSYQYRIYENSYYEEISETEYLKHKGE